MKRVLLAAFLLLLPTVAQARSPQPRGNSGHSYRPPPRSDVTRFLDKGGRFQGLAVEHDGVTRFFDKGRHFQGRAEERGGATQFYDRNGRLQGTAR